MEILHDAIKATDKAIKFKKGRNKQMTEWMFDKELFEMRKLLLVVINSRASLNITVQWKN